jgi:hypothetical protein
MSFGGGELVEAEDGRHCVVELRVPFVEHRPEFAVGKEWPIHRKRLVPIEESEVALRATVELHLDPAPFERGAPRPLAADDRLAAHALDGERGDDLGPGMVEVAPSLAPDYGSLRATRAVAREEHLERLCEARLTRTVPPDDESEPRPRRVR